MEEQNTCTHDCSTCGADCASRGETEIQKEPLNPASSVRHVIGVVSGKGGVGKSMVTSMLATEMRRRSWGVAVLDADITGPSVPKAFGVSGGVEVSGETMLPAYTKTGIQLMSVNLLLEDASSPVVWRGPVIAGAVKQFWTDVIWGDLYYLFVDMPPGTGDVPLTVFQSLPVDGIIVVASPQELVSMIVSKAVKMAQMMNIPILGLVENMSYFECPDCKKQFEVFGKSHINEVSIEYNIPVLAKIPINPELSKAVDSGKIEEFEQDWLKPAIDRIGDC